MIIIKTLLEWSKIIKDQETSDLTQKSYCNKHNIKEGTFSKAKTKLKNQKNRATEPLPSESQNWVSLNLSEEKDNNTATSSHLTIEINNFKIIVGEKFNKKLFLEVCIELQKLC